MKERMIPLRLADQAVAACEAELQKLRAENAALKKALDSKGRRSAKRKPAAKTPQGWRKMSSVPHDVEVEVKLTTEGTTSSLVAKARVDAHGFYLGKVYWARFAPDGTARLAAWRPLK